MKKLVLVLTVVLFMAVNVLADTFTVAEFDASRYVDVLKRFESMNGAFVYDTKTDRFFIFTYEYSTKSWLVLTREDLVKMRATINKYIAWEKQARTSGVVVEKQIPNSTISTTVIWNHVDNGFMGYGLKIMFNFFSQDTNNHQLVIYTNKIGSSENRYITYKLNPIYLNLEQARLLLDAISDTTINKAIQKNNNDKKNADMFQ